MIVLLSYEHKTYEEQKIVAREDRFIATFQRIGGKAQAMCDITYMKKKTQHVVVVVLNIATAY